MVRTCHIQPVVQLIRRLRDSLEFKNMTLHAARRRSDLTVKIKFLQPY